MYSSSPSRPVDNRSVLSPARAPGAALLTPARARRSLYASYDGGIYASHGPTMSGGYPIKMGPRTVVGVEQQRGNQTYFIPPGTVAPTD